MNPPNQEVLNGALRTLEQLANPQMTREQLLSMQATQIQQLSDNIEQIRTQGSDAERLLRSRMLERTHAQLGTRIQLIETAMDISQDIRSGLLEKLRSLQTELVRSNVPAILDDDASTGKRVYANALTYVDRAGLYVRDNPREVAVVAGIGGLAIVGTALAYYLTRPVEAARDGVDGASRWFGGLWRRMIITAAAAAAVGGVYLGFPQISAAATGLLKRTQERSKEAEEARKKTESRLQEIDKQRPLTDQAMNAFTAANGDAAARAANTFPAIVKGAREQVENELKLLGNLQELPFLRRPILATRVQNLQTMQQTLSAVQVPAPNAQPSPGPQPNAPAPNPEPNVPAPNPQPNPIVPPIAPVSPNTPPPNPQPNAPAAPNTPPPSPEVANLTLEQIETRVTEIMNSLPEGNILNGQEYQIGPFMARMGPSRVYLKRVGEGNERYRGLRLGLTWRRTILGRTVNVVNDLELPIQHSYRQGNQMEFRLRNISRLLQPLERLAARNLQDVNTTPLVHAIEAFQGGATSYQSVADVPYGLGQTVLNVRVVQ